MAPYTSAQNGRAEQLHRMILDKVHAMILSCMAPTTLWDEFCATSAYLTNLTPSSSLQGHTPFELWYGRKPSLSHLWEIGCRAYALIPTATPKTYARSCPCVLIGYSPHSKAYQLWDHTSGRVFDSFHVLFIEHLDEVPTDLFPDMTITLTPDSPPSWDTAPTAPAPKAPAPTLCTLTHPLIIPPLPSHFPHVDATNNRITNNTVNNNTVNIQNLPPTIYTSLPSSSETSNQPLTIPPSIPPIIFPSNNTVETPPLCRSSRTRFSSAWEATNDGLLPSSCLSCAISDAIASSTCVHTMRSSRLSSVPEAHISTFIDDLPSYNFTHTFLSEFSDVCETHDLLPLDLPPNCGLLLDVFLSDVKTGSLEPVCETSVAATWLRTGPASRSWPFCDSVNRTDPGKSHGSNDR